MSAIIIISYNLCILSAKYIVLHIMCSMNEKQMNKEINS